jgi:hypothetical protein
VIKELIREAYIEFALNKKEGAFMDETLKNLFSVSWWIGVFFYGYYN